MSEKLSVSKNMQGCHHANKSICLPIITPHYEATYKENPNSKAKKPRKIFQYADYIIEMPDKISDIIEMMEERPRFAALKKYVQNILKMQNNPDYRTRYIIDAQTTNDAYLAMLYINHYLGAEGFHYRMDYNQTYAFDATWKHNSNFQNRTNSQKRDDDGNAVLTKPMEQKDDEDTHNIRPLNSPEWMCMTYPMYILEGSDNFSQNVNDEDFLKFSLMFVLEARKSTSSLQNGGMGMGFGGFDSLDGCGLEINNPTREPKDILILNGFKRIYIPDAGTDELKFLFEKISAQAGVKLSKALKFDVIMREYGERYFNTEIDLRHVIIALKEIKLFNGKADSPLIYADFVDYFDAEAEARKKHAAAKMKQRKSDKTANPWDELNNMVGNMSLKREVRKMVDLLLLEKRRKEHGLPSTALTRHAVFAGNPGSAKTTCARLIARILQHEGIIAGDNFRECVKSDIVGQFVGWTAAGVDGIFKEMSVSGGGVLFLDEAYTYTEKDSTCFDKEAINCITQNMENYRNVMCIFAGYAEPMKQFIEANPGLRSRIGFTFAFSDYNAGEMFKIAEYQAKSLGFSLPAGCQRMLTDYFAELIKLQREAFGNGREARKLIEASALELAGRLSARKRKASKSECSILTVCDLETAIKNSLEREKSFGREQRRQIGFCNV